ncbi:MAG: DUF3054 domain-containing protein [Haloferacaceae archaeon]
MFDDRIHRAAAPMAVGDVLVLAVVFALGTARHQGFAVLTDRPLYVLATIAPFLFGWAVASLPLGAYAIGAVESSTAAVYLALRAWLVGDLIALALRATPWLHGGVELSFLLVTLLFGALGLAVWRVVYHRFA